MAIGRGGSWGRIGSRVRRGTVLVGALAATALACPAMVLTAPPAGASAVTNAFVCAKNSAGDCLATTVAGTTTGASFEFFATSGLVGDVDSIIIDAPVTSQFSVDGTYTVEPSSRSGTSCVAHSVAFSNSDATVAIGVPRNCAAGAGQQVMVFVSSVTMPAAAGYYAWGVRTSSDSTEVPTDLLAVTSVPDAPTSPEAVPSPGSLLVGWTAPAFTGLLPLTAYDVYCSPGAPPSTSGTPTASVGPSGFQVALKGLTNGIPYQCVVTALNSVGQSAASPIATGTPNVTVPGPPQFVQATNGARAVTVRWGRTSSTGGRPITAYDVYCSLSNPPPTSGPPSASVPPTTSPLAATINHLLVGHKYFCVVTAVNHIGPSAPSSVVSAYAATVPLRPTSVSATATGAHGILVSWTAPLHSGGVPVTGYVVYCSSATPANAVCAQAGASATSAQVNALAPSTTYTIYVVAVNAIGYSGDSERVSATTAS